ncbi:MAG: ElaA protein [Candidatus Aldehydirespiratoraceae bacterium]|jgi:ElaA protein
MEIQDRRFVELTATEVHDILRLRIDVFVVEQDCPYTEIDGRDVEAATRHVWQGDDRGPAVYVRLLDDGAARRIGRVVTRLDARKGGLARVLLDHVIATSDGPWVLDAQSHLKDWYRAHGFEPDGPEFIEDGIPHIPMRRERARSVVDD